MNYFKEIIHGTKTLLIGMKVTGVYFFRNWLTRKDVITQQYPDNIDTLKMFDRFRGEVIMTHNEKNEMKCDACTLCENACPNGSIEIIHDSEINPETGKKKRFLVKHIYHLEMCTMCGACIEVCPGEALAWGQDFHHSTSDRASLTKALNKPGSKFNPDLIEKKAKPAPAAPKAKPKEPKVEATVETKNDKIEE